MMQFGKGRSIWYSSLVLVSISGCNDAGQDQDHPRLDFKRFAVDSGSPGANPWGKAAADLNDDQYLDLIVGNHGEHSLTVYYGPSWAKDILVSGQAFATDVEIADINGDGQLDIVTITDEQLLWFRSPYWTQNVIAQREFHDIQLADLDADGRIDVVARDQSAFGGDGDRVWIYYQQDANQWAQNSYAVPSGEGLALGDLNQDGRLDIVVNSEWLENAGGRSWTAHRYSESWLWPNTVIALGDLNGDGLEDILLTPSELAGQQYRVSWFENIGHAKQIWPEHVIDDNVEAVLHSAAIGDVDLDGDHDVLVAAMHQGENPDLVTVYISDNNGRDWSRRTVDNIGSHGAKFVDVDGDGDLDIFGANWEGANQEIFVWENLTCPNHEETWIRHEIDGQRPGAKAPFVEAADLDNDGQLDVISGGYWYKNPGDINSDWRRISLGTDQPDLVKTMDLDHDGDVDVLVLVNAAEGKEFRWLQNTGGARFLPIDTGITATGDFLQGVTELPGVAEESAVALSWHRPGYPVELLRRSDGESEKWVLEKLSDISQDEALSSGDIDGDGDIDVLLGTIWIRNEGDRWTTFQIDSKAPAPDRNVLADIDGDGFLDAVVGFEAISKEGNLVWYRNNGDPSSRWEKHHIGRIVGPMSVGVADIDFDGDLDVIAGEHNLDQPDNAALWVFENTDGSGNIWSRHLVYRGDEHHDGALVVDIDGDGDFDIVSIGWGHSKVLLYENRNPRCPKDG